MTRVLIDCDGVLTDGKLYMAADGSKMFKAFHTRDIRAIREFVARGFEVVIVTADDWPGVQHFAAKVGAELCVMRDKANLAPMFEGPYIAIGDDAWDAPMLRGAALAFAPEGAHVSVTSIPGIVLVGCRSGEGVVAAVLDSLLASGALKPL
jgi:3-deoxy-D-manno-octulosonate 8-phosphate phosphatase KdsC-like HAD superfamily phosphatase